MSADPEVTFPDSAVSMALGVCDGHCVPDECVCPSAAQRVAEIQAAVKAERERIVAYLREHLGTWEPECSGCDSFEAFGDRIDDIERGEHHA